MALYEFFLFFTWFLCTPQKSLMFAILPLLVSPSQLILTQISLSSVGINWSKVLILRRTSLGVYKPRRIRSLCHHTVGFPEVLGESKASDRACSVLEPTWSVSGEAVRIKQTGSIRLYHCLLLCYKMSHLGGKCAFKLFCWDQTLS